MGYKNYSRAIFRCGFLQGSSSITTILMSVCLHLYTVPLLLVSVLFFFWVLGFELKAYTLSHSTSTFFVIFVCFVFLR
jgi:hypothetical protein